MNEREDTRDARDNAAESFAKGLFSGVVAEQAIFPWPEPSRGEADHVHALLDGIRKAAKSVHSSALDQAEAIAPETLAPFKELGLFGLLVPKEYGGLGLGTTGYARVVQELATVDAALAMTIASHQSPGVMAVLALGSDEQRRAYLTRLARGELVAAFALTEEGAGSDAAGIQTRADLVPVTEGDGYRLRGEKIWVTNGGLADLFTVFARTSSAEDGAKPRITAFLVERGPGVTSGASEPKLGVRALSTTRVFFDGARVPGSAVLGEIGRGFKVAMELLTHARLGQAAMCLGSSKKLLKMTVDRVSARKAFGRSLSGFALVKDRVAGMTADLFALESLTYLTTGLVDAGRADFAIESAICKVFGSEALWRIANEAQQIAAGLGYSRAHPWERLLRDARIHMVNQGTNEVLRCFIALSGMEGAGRELEEVGRSLREPIKGFGLLSDKALKRARSALFPERRERLSKASPVLARESVLFEEYVGHLARSVDTVLRRHGKNISEMQFTQKRVADIAIDLYALAACISRTTRAIERRGEEGARRELDLTSVFASAAEKRLIENVAAFEKNDDELRKSVAAKTCADGGYPLDVI
jgi:acyl-CoA dehydrogenase family protein 9